jgi:hypothetical protein
VSVASRIGSLRAAGARAGLLRLPVLLSLQSLGLALLLTWPSLIRPGRVLGGIDADTMKHVWTLWWCRAHLLREGLGLHTGLLNQPEGLDLWPVEPLNGLGSALLAWLPVIATANILAMLNLSLTGLFAGLLGWELSRERSSALAVAFLVQTSSFALFTIHVGVGELQHLWLLPLGCWCLLRLAATQRWRFVLCTGLVLGLGTVACFYYGFYLALALLVLGAAALVGAQRRLLLLGQLLLAAGLAALIVLPVTRAFAASYGDSFVVSAGFFDYLFREGLGQTVVDPVAARLQPADLVIGRSELWGQGYRELEAYGGGKLLGVPMLLLAMVGLSRRPGRGLAWLLVAALGVLLALGSYLSVGGSELIVGGTRLRLPFLFLNRALALLAEPLNFPVRFLALTTIGLSCLGGLALKGQGPRLRWVLLPLVLLNAVDLQLRGLLPWPLPSFEPPALADLAVMDADGPAGGRGAVLDLGAAFRHDQESRLVVMSSQLHHQQPIQAVPIDRLEFHVREGRWFAAGLQLVEDLGPAYTRKGPPASGDYRGDFHMLRQAGFDRVLVVSMGGREPIPAPLSGALDEALGEPLATGPIFAVYGIPQVEASPEQAQAWQAEHAQRSQQAERETESPGAMPTMGPSRPPPPPTRARD